jgi:hypothetical protein
LANLIALAKSAVSLADYIVASFMGPLLPLMALNRLPFWAYYGLAWKLALLRSGLLKSRPRLLGQLKEKPELRCY